MTQSRAVFGTSSQLLGKAGLEMPFLVLVHVTVVRLGLDDMIVGGQQEAAGAAGRVADGVFGSRIDAVDDPKDQFAGREVLARTFGAFGGAFGQQAFVNIAFDIGLACWTSFRCRSARRSSGGAWRGFGYPAAPF